MSACRSWFVSKVNWFFIKDQLMANARTTVIVKQRPTAAVAVKSEKSIKRIFLKKINYLFRLKLY